MNFDDIMNGGLNPEERLGRDITEVYELDTEKTKRNVFDLVKLMQSEDVMDSDIIDTAMSVTTDSKELAVTMHLVMKAVISDLMDSFEEAGSLLDMTRECIEEMGDDVAEQYASLMMSKIIRKGL